MNGGSSGAGSPSAYGAVHLGAPDHALYGADFAGAALYHHANASGAALDGGAGGAYPPYGFMPGPADACYLGVDGKVHAHAQQAHEYAQHALALEHSPVEFSTLPYPML